MDGGGKSVLGSLPVLRWGGEDVGRRKRMCTWRGPRGECEYVAVSGCSGNRVSRRGLLERSVWLGGRYS